MNSCLTYQYRDADNYKVFRDVVLAGVLSIDDLIPYYHEHMFFIPSEVGLEDLQDQPFKPEDHIWHEIIAVNPTEEEPDCIMDAAELKRKFEIAHEAGWNEHEVFRRKGLIWEVGATGHEKS